MLCGQERGASRKREEKLFGFLEIPELVRSFAPDEIFDAVAVQIDRVGTVGRRGNVDTRGNRGGPPNRVDSEELERITSRRTSARILEHGAAVQEFMGAIAVEIVNRGLRNAVARLGNDGDRHVRPCEFW